MFISTPIVRFAVNHFYQAGKISQKQREELILQDLQVNVVLTAAIVVLAAAYLTSV